MIDITKLTEEDIGRWVIYKPNLENEKGRIKSWDLESGFIFVVYKCGGEWNRFKDFTAQVTNPKDLYFVDKKGDII